MQLGSNLEEFCETEPIHIKQDGELVQVKHNYEQF
jgi:hypothetical protein